MLRKLGIAGVLFTTFSLGCSTLRLNPFSSESLVPPITGTIGQCEVEFKPDNGASKKTTVALQSETTVQQVLVRSGALQKFGRMDIELVRKLPNGADHRMTVDFDRGSRRVEAGTDYQVRPDDRLVVREDPSTILDDMLENALGPWVGKSKK